MFVDKIWNQIFLWAVPLVPPLKPRGCEKHQEDTIPAWRCCEHFCRNKNISECICTVLEWDMQPAEFQKTFSLVKYYRQCSITRICIVPFLFDALFLAVDTCCLLYKLEILKHKHSATVVCWNFHYHHHRYPVHHNHCRDMRRKVTLRNKVSPMTSTLLFCSWTLLDRKLL